jgi:hypothetical protein
LPKEVARFAATFMKEGVDTLAYSAPQLVVAGNTTATTPPNKAKKNETTM